MAAPPPYGFPENLWTIPLTGSELLPIQAGSVYPTVISLDMLNDYVLSAGTADFAGQEQINSQNIALIAGSATMPEAASYLNVTSALGAASGNGPVSAYKMAQAIAITAAPGSGNIYGQNIVVTQDAGVGAFSLSGLEIDINNDNHDFPFTGYGGVVSYAFQVLSDSAFEITAAIAIGSIVSTNYAYHAGLFFSTLKGASDYSIYDACDSAYSYNDGGTHASAGFWQHSTTPIGIFTNGIFATAAMQDDSTTPFGLSLVGNYSVAAAYIGGITKMKAYTVATLPAMPNAALVGAVAVVTDALAPTYGAALAGGGGATVMALCNGVAWASH